MKLKLIMVVLTVTALIFQGSAFALSITDVKAVAEDAVEETESSLVAGYGKEKAASMEERPGSSENSVKEVIKKAVKETEPV